VVDTLLGPEPNGQRAIYSDSGDDSTRSSEPSGWDGWHRIRADYAPPPVATVATRATPVGVIHDYRAAGVRQQSGRLGGGCWPGCHLQGFGPTGEGATGGTGLARQMPQAVMLDDGSRHASADRRTSGYDELAGHRPCTAPEPLLPR
jgi:hypothetical protein